MPVKGRTKQDVLLEFRRAEILDAARKICGAMIEEVLAVLHDQVRAQLSKPGPIEEVLRRLVTTKMTYFEEHRDLLRLYYNEVNSIAARPARSREQFERHYLEQVRLLQSALDTAMSEGVLRRMRPDMTALTI